MNKKLILLDNEYYVINDSGIGGDNCWTTKGLFKKDMGNGGIFLNFPNEEYSETYWDYDKCKKITHSTRQLNNIILLNRNDIEEIIQSLLPKTEWNIFISEDNKITLI